MAGSVKGPAVSRRPDSLYCFGSHGLWPIHGMPPAAGTGFRCVPERRYGGSCLLSVAAEEVSCDLHMAEVLGEFFIGVDEGCALGPVCGSAGRVICSWLAVSRCGGAVEFGDVFTQS